VVVCHRLREFRKWHYQKGHGMVDYKAAVEISMKAVKQVKSQWFHNLIFPGCHERIRELSHSEQEIACAIMVMFDALRIDCEGDSVVLLGKGAIKDPSLAWVLNNAIRAVQKSCPEIYADWLERIRRNRTTPEQDGGCA